MTDVPVIFEYTRAQAVSDGVLVDVSKYSDTPMFFTQALNDRVKEASRKHDNYIEFVHALVVLAAGAASLDVEAGEWFFQGLPNVGPQIWLCIEPDPSGEGKLLWTIGFPSDR